MDNNRKNNSNKIWHVIGIVVTFLIGLWLFIPALLSLLQVSSNGVDFWINVIGLLVGILTIASAIKSLWHMKIS
ncbi:hypothetical protein KII95_07665 [Leuconostoc gelidum subsp. aenigmaticum]|uniref:hypothetical protein n=1 Tax=Leuconostoc gelidum TaxID=1244 RepID=UPI001CC7F429|nr:hypothetical protein [Leuconostoc gelidum]MBZ6003891.1 hypothetical protein [Leuconostoc gelidum subsp. aenigmaticum]MBZ6009264.1 hypothetical protein [Leuconostoc gelidum subsp. aenigmaticum]